MGPKARLGDKIMKPIKVAWVRYLWSIGTIFLLTCASEFVIAVENGTVRETEYSTSLSDAAGIVRIIVAAFGGVIGILGVLVVVKGVAGTADVSGSVPKLGSISMKRVSQGVVITLIGAAVLIGALYLLPDKKVEREITGQGITIEEQSGAGRRVTRD